MIRARAAVHLIPMHSTPSTVIGLRVLHDRMPNAFAVGEVADDLPLLRQCGLEQIELLVEAVPRVSRVAVLWDAAIGTVQFQATETASRPAGVTLQSLPFRRVEDIDPAFEQAAREQAQGLVVLSSPLIFAQRSHIADAALNARLPSINLFNSFRSSAG